MLTTALWLLTGCGDDGGGDSAGDTAATTSPGTSGGDDATSVGQNMSDTADTASAGSSGGETGTPPPTTGSDTTAADDSSGGSTGAAACEGMSFFATSAGSGVDGGNLGGLAGADARCQAFADAVGQGACTWHAYLSSSTEDARDRIGTGPWQNSAGETIAASVEALHTDGLSNDDPQHVLDENGLAVPGNEHDILTGSQEDGTLLPDATCADWTSDSQDDDAGVGHSDIPQNPMFSPSWNQAHVVNGCREQDLESTGGAGRLYCFAL
jgi:hypothetical protein